MTQAPYSLGQVTIDEAATTFSCRDGSAPGGVFTVDLRKVAGQMARLAEVRYVTREKAPELLDALRGAHEGLGEVLGMVGYQHDRAKLHLAQERARVLLDEVPAMIPKGSPTSDTIRRAHVDRYPSVVAMGETEAALKAIRALLANKQEAVGRAFSAVKAVVLGEQVRGFGSRSIGAGTGTTVVGGDEFGTP